jgi:predicted nucleic-acid-binding Zn-ribbon protein
MTLIVDVDLDLLKELHEHGSVRILKDRRTDLYDIKKNKSMNKTCLECGEKL